MSISHLQRKLAILAADMVRKTTTTKQINEVHRNLKEYGDRICPILRNKNLMAVTVSSLHGLKFMLERPSRDPDVTTFVQSRP